MSMVIKLSLIQFVFTLIFSGVIYFLWGTLHGVSAFIGGMIYFIANGFFSIRMILGKKRYSDAESAKKFVKVMYQSEFFKLLITIVLFAFAFGRLEVQPEPALAIYVLVVLSNLFVVPFLK